MKEWILNLKNKVYCAIESRGNIGSKITCVERKEDPACFPNKESVVGAVLQELDLAETLILQAISSQSKRRTASKLTTINSLTRAKELIRTSKRRLGEAKSFESDS